MEPALATGCGGQANKKRWTEEPYGEGEPCGSCEEPLKGPACAISRGSEKEREECGRGPCPSPLEKDEVEETALRS